MEEKGGRVSTVLKKAGELSTLCGADVCVVIRDPISGKIYTWPQDSFEIDRINNRYLNCPNSKKRRYVAAVDKAKKTTNKKRRVITSQQQQLVVSECEIGSESPLFEFGSSSSSSSSSSSFQESSDLAISGLGFEVDHHHHQQQPQLSMSGVEIDDHQLSEVQSEEASQIDVDGFDLDFDDLDFDLDYQIPDDHYDPTCRDYDPTCCGVQSEEAPQFDFDFDVDDGFGLGDLHFDRDLLEKFRSELPLGDYDYSPTCCDVQSFCC